jgi:exodeoxyribonuclease-1
MALVFYDTETTGTDTSFDQILQFAAIQTDEDLKEIDRFEMRCRLLPHVVPSPDAMKVNGVRLSQLIDPKCPSHYEMVRAIRAKLLSWCPALFVGWNSIKFDEGLLRQAFYMTLHKPYLTNSDGNSRSDVMRIVQACSLHSPDALTFPTDENGQIIFKLDQVAPENGFKHDRAHDAMGDVEATIFLCRLLMAKAPDVWSAFMRFSKKAAVVDYIGGEPVFCLSDFYFGKPYSFLVTSIGRNQENNNEWYVYNLEIEPESLMLLAESELAARLAEQPKPVRRLKSNAAPMLFAAGDAPSICKALECGLEEVERRAALLQSDTAFRKRLISAFESRKEEYPPSPHVEKQIYDGFPEESDEKLMDEFHKTAWPKRYAIVQKFQDPRLKEIGTWLIHLERPDVLNKVVSREFDLATAKRLLGHGEDIPWLTLPQALKELEGMLENSSGAELELLRQHHRYLKNRHEQALAHINEHT